jgi:hypothetical protein
VLMEKYSSMTSRAHLSQMISSSVMNRNATIIDSCDDTPFK